ncbi:YHYH protein [Hoeflea ulvae]|uniref:YHYH protein n=1 Tax=Hoeflea ulvae TaxID=2983764 RepID=A0ABT3YJH0_9HYPH|nr:YHYH protein [Hoeflea ulvae]MCY0095967.1 YHYH protein [Hoeflea ulvae]
MTLLPPVTRRAARDACALLAGFAAVAMAHPATAHETTSIDITNAIFAETRADCASYENRYSSRVTDTQQDRALTGAVHVTAFDDHCVLESNSIPNHDTGEGSGRDFVAPVTEISGSFRIPRNPKRHSSATALDQRSYDAILLNGVVVDILSAGCYRPDGNRVDANGNVAIGCRSTDKWLLDPLGPGAGFGADIHHAHTQPNGQYHYHGNPMAMFDDQPGADGSPVIGFAADGFPVFGSWFKDESGAVRKAISGYSLKPGARPSSASDPGGDHDGMYVDDFEFTGTGDLDACNGMVVNGQYGYYVTDSYPWVIKCFSGQPDPSFAKPRP